MLGIQDCVKNMLGSDYLEDDFKLAVTHSSVGTPNNERLEFLGNAVLNMHLVDVLIDTNAELDPGRMSIACNYLRSNAFLSAVGRKNGLDGLIQVGPSMEGTGVDDDAVSTAFEAIIGMLYQKAGYDMAAMFIDDFIVFNMPTLETILTKDEITRLKEFADKNKECPIDHIVSESNQNGKRIYHHLITMKDKQAMGSGKSKKDAEREATMKMLAILDMDRAIY